MAAAPRPTSSPAACRARGALLVLLGLLVGTVLAALPAAAQSTFTVVVQVRDGSYAPAAIEVLPGDVVEFRWVGSEPHSVHAPSAEGLDSHPLCSPDVPLACAQPGEAPYRWEVRGEPGTIQYGDRATDFAQNGTIVIGAARPSPPPDAPADEPSTPPEDDGNTAEPAPATAGEEATPATVDDAGTADPGTDPTPTATPTPTPTPTPGVRAGLRSVPQAIGPVEGAGAAPEVAAPVEPVLKPFPAPADPRAAGPVDGDDPADQPVALDLADDGGGGTARIVGLGVGSSLLVAYGVALGRVLRRDVAA